MVRTRPTAIAALLATAALAACAGGPPPTSAPTSPSASTAPVADGPVAVADMESFCAGQAAARFGVRTLEITTHLPEADGPGYLVHGDFTRVDGSPTVRFHCSFDRQRNYLGLEQN